MLLLLLQQEHAMGMTFKVFARTCRQKEVDVFVERRACWKLVSTCSRWTLFDGVAKEGQTLPCANMAGKAWPSESCRVYRVSVAVSDSAGAREGMSPMQVLDRSPAAWSCSAEAAAGAWETDLG